MRLGQCEQRRSLVLLSDGGLGRSDVGFRQHDDSSFSWVAGLSLGVATAQGAYSYAVAPLPLRLLFCSL